MPLLVGDLLMCPLHSLCVGSEHIVWGTHDIRGVGEVLEEDITQAAAVYGMICCHNSVISNTLSVVYIWPRVGNFASDTFDKVGASVEERRLVGTIIPLNRQEGGLGQSLIEILYWRVW